MNKYPDIVELESDQLKTDIPEFGVGDTVSVHQRIVEGSKERIQIFTGTVIARKGRGAGETLTLHRVAYGEGMERVFLLNSPRISKYEVKRLGKSRSSKLYRLRGTQGKKSRVKERIVGPRTASKKSTPDVAPAEAKPEEE